MMEHAIKDADRIAILDALLVRVPFEGWTERSLRMASEDAGLAASDARAAFPGGLADALRALYRHWDERMIAALDQTDLPAMRIRDRIATAVRIRLGLHHDHREALRRLAALQLTPAYAGDASRALYRTVDAMWRAAGDTATDYNFYTKRALLTGVYTSTTLFWLNDRSPDHRASWAFLDRRIDDVMGIQKLRGRWDRTVTGIADSFRRSARRFGVKRRRKPYGWRSPPA